MSIIEDNTKQPTTHDQVTAPVTNYPQLILELLQQINESKPALNLDSQAKEYGNDEEFKKISKINVCIDHRETKEIQKDYRLDHQ